MGVLYQPSAVHLGYASPWFLVAWAALAGRWLNHEHGLRRRVARTVGVALGTVALSLLPLAPATAVLSGGITWSRAPTGWVPLGTQEDAARYSGSFPEVAGFLEARTSKEDGVVFFPFRSVNNVLLDRRNPLRLDFLYIGENSDAQVEQMIGDLTVDGKAMYVVVETEPAEVMIRQAARIGASETSLRALERIRDRLPLVHSTPWVEIRSGRAESQIGAAPNGE